MPSECHVGGSLEYFCFSLCIKYVFQNRTFCTALEGPPVRHRRGTGDVWAGDRRSPFLTVSVTVSSEPLAGKAKPKFLCGCFKPAPPSFSGQDSVEGDSVLSLKKKAYYLLLTIRRMQRNLEHEDIELQRGN